MNSYQKAVRWIKENIKVEGTEQEIEFMREKARSTLSCIECLSKNNPFPHLLASAVCNATTQVDLGAADMDGYPYNRIDSSAWIHLTELATRWSEELKCLKINGKIT